MSERVSTALAKIIQNNPWMSQVAGILPLSALIDFIDIPVKIHTLQVTGSCPLWSWAITPSGSRLLLSSDSNPNNKTPILDQYGNSISLTGIDGRFGDLYLLPNPETVRTCISSQSAHPIPNKHANMEKPRHELRIQHLEIIHVQRFSPNSTTQQPWPWSSLTRFSPRYITTSLLGYLSLICLITLAIFSKCYLAVAFLLLMPLSGAIVTLTHGDGPRRLLNSDAMTSPYNRLVIVAQNTNSSHWTIFYGESTLVNCLVNRPLEPDETHTLLSSFSPLSTQLLKMLLRLLILAQWALAIATATTQDWNAFYICFWIVFSIFAHAYLIPLRTEIRRWLMTSARIRLCRYTTQLSSRRALLNTVIALNPDTFPAGRSVSEKEGGSESEESTSTATTYVENDTSRLCPGAMKALNPILEPSDQRSLWEEATRQAMMLCEDVPVEERIKGLSSSEGENMLGKEWNEQYGEFYWMPYIIEGIYMAAKIKSQAGLSGRMVGGSGV
ncbi:uncharacterized protein BO88DRAFT_409848 [Aspergillus vadensis CBS 113365]|uniref:Uncharacterized protein n=1 Tax=Aspergillus vadensis (strain CBS 113365 / IMI 142717 / IBT 24658) TaxID=1448311 RepID=A0A319BPM0_ASPVC|nr:hypothetical protein BO88DRAFT_409848 [Aspergillus vadensis CBS 113365]PYH74497.1 hypothetical protein BO88DRAFT_409848 [Aspergillus vadensis CBS 113365]